MKRQYAFQSAPRCTATSKRTKMPCMAPAVNGWSVCRFHGAGGGAPKGKANGSYKSGLHAQEARAVRRDIQDLLRQAKMMIAAINEGDQ